MKIIWKYRIECCIVLMAVLLLLQVMLPPFLQTGMYWCLLFLFIITIVLYRLNAIHEHMQK